MKNLSLVLAVFFLGSGLAAQTPPSAAPAADMIPGAPLSAAELEQLLAPVALYPDALIALILPATTVPTDIVLAARHVRENPGDRSQIEHRAWDESVKSLTHYAEVLLWMDENLDWTRQVGEAFARQPAEVMQAVQRLRAKARAAGTLIDTPQQQVIAEAEVIRIVPAQPDVIYVPRYEPDIIFVDRPVYYSRPYLSFGLGVAAGSWLAFDCDWRRNVIWVGNRHRHWSGHDWRRPVVPISAPHYAPSPGIRAWRPPPVATRPAYVSGPRTRHEVIRPSPIGVAPSRPHYGRSTPHSYAERDRRPEPNHLPVVRPEGASRSFRGPPAQPPMGPHAPTSVNATSSVVASPLAIPNAPMPALQPLPTARRIDRSSERPSDRTVGPRPAPPAVNGAPRGRPSFDPAPAALPTIAPQRGVAPEPQSSFVGPTVRTTPRSRPEFAAPSAPSQSSRHRSAPLPTVTPSVAPAPAPAAAPAPAVQPVPPPQGGESRGHRGGGSYQRGGSNQRDGGWNR